jgi:excisionase family DNA binding protein
MIDHHGRDAGGDPPPDNPAAAKPTRPLTVSVEEAAHLLGISRGHAYALVNRGEIPSLRLGRRIVVPRAALDRLLDIPDDAA